MQADLNSYEEQNGKAYTDPDPAKTRGKLAEEIPFYQNYDWKREKQPQPVEAEATLPSVSEAPTLSTGSDPVQSSTAPKFFQMGKDSPIRQDITRNTIQNYTLQKTAEQYHEPTDEEILRADLDEINAMPHKDRVAFENYYIAFTAPNEAEAMEAYNDFLDSGIKEKYGSQRLKELAESWKRHRNAEFAQQYEQDGKDAVNKGVGSAMLANAGTVPANIVGGISSVLGYRNKSTTSIKTSTRTE